MTDQLVIGGHLRPKIVFEKKAGLIAGSKSGKRPRRTTTNSDSDLVNQLLYDDTHNYYPSIESLDWQPVYKGDQRTMADGSIRQFMWGYRFYVTLKYEWIRGALLADIINNFAKYHKGYFILSTVDFGTSGIWVMPSPDWVAGLRRFKGNTFYGHEHTLSLIGTDLYPAGYALPLRIAKVDDWDDGFWNGIEAQNPDFDSYKEE